MAQYRSTHKAIANIMKWAERPEWSEKYRSVFEAHLGRVSRQRDTSLEQLSRDIEQAGYGGMLFGMVFEDFLTRRWPDAPNIVDDYLARRGWREDVPGRRYLEMLRDSALSVYELAAVAPGQYCDIVDLLGGGEAVRVYEQLGTRNLVKWDRIAARVLRQGNRHVFSGGILPLSFDIVRELSGRLDRARNRTKDELEEIAGRKVTAALRDVQMTNLTREMLPPYVTQLWLADTLTRLAAPFPGLMNDEGEEIVFCETRIPVSDHDRDAIADRLDSSPDWDRTGDNELFWNWLVPQDAQPVAGHGTGLRLESRVVGVGRTCGTLELQSRAIILQTNSVGRSDRAKQRLRELLDERIGTPLTTLKTVQQVMQERERHPMDAPGSNVLDPKLAARLERQILDDHYRKTLDEPIPMLGNLSPRRCAKTAEGRIKLIEWLKQLENNALRQSAQAGTAPYDSAWIWKELGVSDRR